MKKKVISGKRLKKSGIRTTIDIDDKLLKEAFKFAKSKTKSDLVDEALSEFIDNRKRTLHFILLNNQKNKKR